MNKYKKFSKLPIPDEGEVALSYGVQFLSSPEIKPHRHSQERPFLVIDKDDDENILAFKINGRKEKIYTNNYYLESKKYNHEIMPKDSVIEMEYVYKLGRGDFIKRGFKITQSEYYRILEKAIFLYVNNMNSIDQESAKILFKKLYKGRQAKIGDVIKVNYIETYLFVYDIENTVCKCIALHKEKTNPDNEQEIIGGVQSFIDYSEEDICIPRNEVLYYTNGAIKNKQIKRIVAKKELLNVYKSSENKDFRLKKA